METNEFYWTPETEDLGKHTLDFIVYDTNNIQTQQTFQLNVLMSPCEVTDTTFINIQDTTIIEKVDTIIIIQKDNTGTKETDPTEIVKTTLPGGSLSMLYAFEKVHELAT